MKMLITLLIGSLFAIGAHAEPARLAGTSSALRCPNGYLPYAGKACVSRPHAPYGFSSVIYPDGTRAKNCSIVMGRIAC